MTRGISGDKDIKSITPKARDRNRVCTLNQWQHSAKVQLRSGCSRKRQVCVKGSYGTVPSPKKTSQQPSSKARWKTGGHRIFGLVADRCHERLTFALSVRPLTSHRGQHLSAERGRTKLQVHLQTSPCSPDDSESINMFEMSSPQELSAIPGGDRWSSHRGKGSQFL